MDGQMLAMFSWWLDLCKQPNLSLSGAYQRTVAARESWRGAQWPTNGADELSVD